MSKFKVSDEVKVGVTGQLEWIEGVVHSVCDPDDPDKFYTVAVYNEGIFLRIKEEDITPSDKYDRKRNYPFNFNIDNLIENAVEPRRSREGIIMMPEEDWEEQPKQYKRRVKNVEAILFTGSYESESAASEFVGVGNFLVHVLADGTVNHIIREELEGIGKTVKPNEYIIRTPYGYYYTMEKDKFERNFEEVRSSDA